MVGDVAGIRHGETIGIDADARVALPHVPEVPVDVLVDQQVSAEDIADVPHPVGRTSESTVVLQTFARTAVQVISEVQFVDGRVSGTVVLDALDCFRELITKPCDFVVAHLRESVAHNLSCSEMQSRGLRGTPAV